MKRFKQFLSEDIINVLDDTADLLRNGDLDNIPKSHINTLAVLRVYVYSNNEDDKASVGINTLVGEEISDANAIKALASFLNLGGRKTQGVAKNEVHTVRKMLADGQKNGYKDILEVIEFLKNRLRKL
ncbi:MAG: hypothetical protein JXR12_01480 [Neptunomonas phycophila]|uniref:hypothetical protein n=1 Tax=Neptunomonas phycophila TaxID=1572645 RepID=UPI003B8DE27D